MSLLAALRRISLLSLPVNEPGDAVTCRRAAVRTAQHATEAYIKSENMAFARACRVVDLSVWGAQLELREGDIASALLGGEMILFFCDGQSEVRCTLAWRKGRRMGVRFRGGPRLSRGTKR
jgi:hypothetical protein